MLKSNKTKNAQPTDLGELADDLHQTIEDNRKTREQDTSTSEALLTKKGFIPAQIKAFLNKLGL